MKFNFDSIGRDFQQSLKKLLREYAEALVLAVLLALILRSFVLSTYRVTTESMAPVLRKGDFVLGFKMPYGANLPFAKAKFGEVRVTLNDLAVFSCPVDQYERICVSRIVGVPGDKIEIADGVLLRNDRQIRRYGGSSLQLPALIIPPETVFVLSDGEAVQQDSRHLGPVSFSSLEAKVLWIWFSYWNGPQWARIGPPTH